MSIVRISHDKEKPYVMLNREAINDPQVSWAAKGLWTFLISKPDNWQVSVAHLSSVYGGKKRGNGRDGVRELLRELKEEGYVSTTEVRDKGQFLSLDYTVYESKQPVTSPAAKSNDNPTQLKKRVPKTPEPFTVKPEPVTPRQTIKNDKEERYKENDNNVTDYRSSHTLDSIVSFDPETYTLPNGERLSLKMRRSLAKYTEKDKQKLHANVSYFHEQIAKGKKWDNPEAYLQSCIKNNYAQGQTNAWQNKLYATWMKEEHKMRNLTILKTVVQMKKNSNEPAESLSYTLPAETFTAALDSFIRNHKE